MVEIPKRIGADEQTLMRHNAHHVMASQRLRIGVCLGVIPLQAQGVVRFLWVDEVRSTHVPRVNSVCLSIIWKLEPAVRLVIGKVFVGTSPVTV